VTENSFFLQCMINSQLLSYIVGEENKYKVKEILKKRVIWCCKEFKKKYLVKSIERYKYSYYTMSFSETSKLCCLWAHLDQES